MSLRLALRGKSRLTWMPFFILVTASVFLSGSPLVAEDTSNRDAPMLTMDFEDVELEVVIRFMSKLTGKNFVFDEKVKGKKVTIICPTEISKDEAYRVFESILATKGLTTVPAGKVIKIVPTRNASSKSLKTIVDQ